MTGLFDLTHIITTYGYIGIFIIIFLESGIFPPLPGDSLLFAAGLYAVSGGFNIYFLLALVFAASFFGIFSGYQLGTNLEKLKRFSFVSKIYKQKYIDEAHQFFAKHGKATIIFSRFVPIVRTFVPIVAGAAKMEYKSFLKYSLVGSIIWAGSFIGGGYFLGKVFPQIQEYLTWVIIVIVILSILPGVYHWYKARK